MRRFWRNLWSGLAVLILISATLTVGADGIAPAATRPAPKPKPAIKKKSPFDAWSPPRFAINGFNSTLGMACAPGGFCLSVGHDGTTDVDHNGNWSTSPTPALPVILSGIDISCASSTLCLANNTGVLYSWNGSAWTNLDPGRKPDPTNTILVSCVSANQPACFVLTSRQFSRYTTPTASTTAGTVPPQPPSGLEFGSLDCTSPTSCEYLGQGLYGDTRAASWDGTAWSSQSPPTLSAQADIGDLSCVGPSLCTMVTPVPNKLPLIWHLTPLGWSGPYSTLARTRAANEEFQGVACFTLALCLDANPLNGHDGVIVAVTTSPSIQDSDVPLGDLVTLSCAGGTCTALQENGDATTLQVHLAAPTIDHLSVTSGSTTGIAPWTSALLPPPPPITITGTHLLDTDNVLFGSTPAADVQVVNDNTLRVQPPPGAAGSVPVTVIGPDGPSMATGLTYRYRPVTSAIRLTGRTATISPAGVGRTTIQATVDVTGGPVPASRLTWNPNGTGTEEVNLAALPPGTRTLDVTTTGTLPTSVGAIDAVCLQVPGTADQCVASHLPPPVIHHSATVPWWGWLLIALGALALLAGAGGLVRHRLSAA